MKKKESISITLPKDYVKELDIIAEETNIKRSNLVQKGVEIFLKEYKRKNKNQLELPTTF